MNLKIKKGNDFLGYNRFNFPGGEIGIKLNARDYKYRLASASHQTIIARLQSSDDILSISMVKNALEQFDANDIDKPATPINLFIPYVPYARQDRVCDSGESFSLKVFCDYLNSLNFNKVTILDPHSDVCPALLNNVRVISQFDIFNKWQALIERVMKGVTFVSPDAGANKKTAQLAGYFSHNEFVRADKLRDLSNGNIKETIVYCDDFKGRDVIVADDILDGARTFIELAKICKKKNCGKFILYATHSIFSKGAKICFQNGIDEIWTTNSFHWITDPNEVYYYEKINVMNLEERLEI